MKSRVVLSVVAVIGILGLSATAAHAGSGGSPSPLISFFVCHGINGDDPGKVVDVEPSVFGAIRQKVRIGNGILACAVASLFHAGTNNEINPIPATGSHEQLKCYTVSVSRKTSTPPGQAPTLYTATDELLGTEQNIQASELRYICAPATFTITP